MTALTTLGARPGPGADATAPSGYRRVGLALAVVGLMGVAAAAIGNFTAAANIDAANGYKETLAWTFGLSVFSFGVVKISIAIILMGIIVRLWFRVDAVGSALTLLHGHSDAPQPAVGPLDTEWGAAEVSLEEPEPLLIHRMARTMWRPMLLMGAMGVTTGLISSWVWADTTPGTESFRQAAAWTRGIEFLGEAMILTGISFLLGTILAGLREGGGEVQHRLGLRVTTLKMPITVKAFVGLMALGLMAGIGQFVVSLVQISNADDPVSFASVAAWLNPFQELTLALILAGIVLALVSIANVLSFQFHRVTSIIRTGV